MGRQRHEATTGVRDCVPTRAALFWGLVAAGVVLDQATKVAVMLTLSVGQKLIIVCRVFCLAHSQNAGIVFGIGSDFGPAGRAFLGLVNVVIIGVVIYIRTKARIPAMRRAFDLAMGLILAGAFGNMIDRAHPPFKVIDFLDFGLGTWWRYPTFNVADIYIVIGVGVYIYWTLAVEKRVKAAERD